MFDRLDDLLIRYEEVMGELQEPDVANEYMNSAVSCIRLLYFFSSSSDGLAR